MKSTLNLFGGVVKTLTRNEQKNIMGALAAPTDCKTECSSNSDCPIGTSCHPVACGGQQIYYMCY